MTTATTPAHTIADAPEAHLGVALSAVAELETTLQKALEFTGLVFDTGLPEHDYAAGERGAHRCDYRISLTGERFLGRLEISRHWPFKESELRLLECCLADFCLRLNLLVPQDPPSAQPESADRTP